MAARIGRQRWRNGYRRGRPGWRLADLRTALEADLPAMREVFHALFPEGLTFRPTENAARRVWAISGTARLDSLN